MKTYYGAEFVILTLSSGDFIGILCTENAEEITNGWQIPESLFALPSLVFFQLAMLIKFNNLHLSGCSDALIPPTHCSAVLETIPKGPGAVVLHPSTTTRPNPPHNYSLKAKKSFRPPPWTTAIFKWLQNVTLNL